MKDIKDLISLRVKCVEKQLYSSKDATEYIYRDVKRIVYASVIIGFMFGVLITYILFVLSIFSTH